MNPPSHGSLHIPRRLAVCCACLLLWGCADAPGERPTASVVPVLLDPSDARDVGVRVPLHDGLGDHHVPISTEVPLAQSYFDQGMRLYYAFNHPEAIRAFEEASRLDPTCGICRWGIALALGPNINAPMDSAAAAHAFAAVEWARARAGTSSPRERALIEALAARYAAADGADRAVLDSAYAAAMGRVARDHRDDLEAAVLHGEALMDLRPWAYWTQEGRPYPGTEEALRQFERVLARNPEHPGACHFLIHLVEAVQPERAVPCAESLATLMPGAGHLVHMPGHIYIRVGRYADAIAANEHAVHADEYYIRDRRPGMNFYTAGYYPHNYDFLAFAAAMAGRSQQSIGAADMLRELIPEEMLGVPEMTFLEHWSVRPMLMRVRFGRWDELLATPEPAENLAHARALWHYGRGTALAARGDVSGAEAELERLAAMATAPYLEGRSLEFNEARAILRIAAASLSGRIAAIAGRHDAAVAALEDAVRLEDSLVYGEPPEWSVPVRQELGVTLLAAGRAAHAEAAFLADLERFPENGWSLHGLWRSLHEQGRTSEAGAVRRRFEAAWAGADVALD